MKLKQYEKKLSTLYQNNQKNKKRFKQLKKKLWLLNQYLHPTPRQNNRKMRIILKLRKLKRYKQSFLDKTKLPRKHFQRFNTILTKISNSHPKKYRGWINFETLQRLYRNDRFYFLVWCQVTNETYISGTNRGIANLLRSNKFLDKTAIAQDIYKYSPRDPNFAQKCKKRIKQDKNIYITTKTASRILKTSNTVHKRHGKRKYIKRNDTKNHLKPYQVVRLKNIYYGKRVYGINRKPTRVVSLNDYLDFIISHFDSMFTDRTKRLFKQYRTLRDIPRHLITQREFTIYFDNQIELRFIGKMMKRFSNQSNRFGWEELVYKVLLSKIKSILDMNFGKKYAQHFLGFKIPKIGFIPPWTSIETWLHTKNKVDFRSISERNMIFKKIDGNVIGHLGNGLNMIKNCQKLMLNHSSRNTINDYDAKSIRYQHSLMYTSHPYLTRSRLVNHINSRYSNKSFRQALETRDGKTKKRIHSINVRNITRYSKNNKKRL